MQCFHWYNRLFVFPIFLLLFGCLGMGERRSEYLIVDAHTVPIQLVETKSEGELNVLEISMEDPTIRIEKRIKVKDHQGWFLLHPDTFKQLVIAAIGQKMGRKIIVLSPESSPVKLMDKDVSFDVSVRLVDLTVNEEKTVKVKLKDYYGWILLHPITYKRLVNTGLRNFNK